jgi:hypothetical protein
MVILTLQGLGWILRKHFWANTWYPAAEQEELRTLTGQYFFDSGLPCIGRPILLSHYSSKHFGKLNCVSNNEHVIPGCKYCDHKMEEESQLSWRLGGLADLFWAHWNVCLIIVYCTYRSWSCLRNRKTPSGKDVIWLSWRYL